MLEKNLDPAIFRAYDIRGVVGQNLNEENIFLIGQAIGSLLRRKGKNQLSLARDGRISGPKLSQALCNGLLATGCDVIDLGSVPTPLLYYATSVFDEHSGIMLTGSHNPANYNGLKIVIDGTTLTEENIQRLYHAILAHDFVEGQGVRHEFNIVDRYLNHIARDICIHRPMTVALDAGNGIAGGIAPILYRLLGCEVHELYCEVDGNFPHHHPDPSQPENLQDLIQLVRSKNADIGLAFDGDGDRLGVVTNLGEMIYPDRILMFFAQAILAEHPNAKIIYDIKCTQHLETVIRSFSGEPIMWKTGHSLIKAKLAETQAKLAGEMSGHFFFKDRWYGFDDALYAGARLLEILSRQKIHADKIFAAFPNSVNTPELKVSVSENEKFGLMDSLIKNANFSEAKEVTTLDGLRVNFAEGWGLVRVSNTSPNLILRFEAINEVILKKIQNLFRNLMLEVKPDWVLPF